jgi:hypothetical protein
MSGHWDHAQNREQRVPRSQARLRKAILREVERDPDITLSYLAWKLNQTERVVRFAARGIKDFET